MRPYGTPAALEARHRRVVALLEDGLGVREAARKIGCSPASVSRWEADVQTGDRDALQAKPPPGRPPRLNARWNRDRPRWAKSVQNWLAARQWIVVEWLPPYAPDLNPVECVWSHTKYGDLANFAPDCLRTLEQAVVTSLSQTRSRRDLFKAFFRGAGLEP